jgi:TetR/AcrR family transcriptional repressor of nem operon
MGHSQAEKAESHERILRIASRQMREDGLGALSVADLMKAAGLTHGGFYGHFCSRDALIEEAFARALGAGAKDAVAPGEAAPDAGSAASLRTWVRSYLSRDHRDRPATGCAMAALAGDIGRSDKNLRALFTRYLKRFQDSMTRLVSGDGPAARRQALAAVSTMMGALILARAVDDETLSDEILMAAKQSIIALGDA